MRSRSEDGMDWAGQKGRRVVCIATLVLEHDGDQATELSEVLPSLTPVM